MSLLQKLFGSTPPSTLISSAFSDIGDMLVHARAMLETALTSLLDNQPLVEDLDRMDDEIDQGERLVRRSVLEHLSMRPGQDLVSSLVLVSIVQDCERLGDFARGLGDILSLAGEPRSGVFRDRLADLRGRLMPLFDETGAAFLEGDADRAQTVVETAAGLKEELGSFVGDVAASDLGADMAVVYSASARILGRVASHLSNICSAVVQPYDRLRHGDEEA